MNGSIAIVIIAGCAAYGWLTLAGPPIASAIMSTIRRGHRKGWPAAWPTALGSALLVTVIPAAAVVLVMPAAPDVSRTVLQAPELLLGLKIGGILWLARAGVFGLPRLPPKYELSIVLAAAALWTLDPAARKALERKYRRHMLRSDPAQELAEPPDGVAA